MTNSKKILLAIITLMLCMVTEAQNTDRLDFVVRHATLKPAMRHASFAVCVHNITKAAPSTPATTTCPCSPQP